MNVSLISPMKKMMLPIATLMLAAGAATSCEKWDPRGEVTICDPYYPPFDFPLNADSATLAKLDSLLAVTRYKIDSIMKTSGDSHTLDSIINDADKKWYEMCQ